MDDYSFAKEDTDYSFAKPEEDYSFATPEKVEPTFKYATKDDYEDLKRNIGEVGYSGLDDNQKKLFEDQFAHSKFALAGGTLEDAIKYTDSQSNRLNPTTWDNIKTVVGAMPQAGFQAARDVLSYPVSAGLSYLDALQTHVGVDETGHAIPRYEDNPSYLERVGRSQEELMDQARKNEGLPGMLANPTNLLAGVIKVPAVAGEAVLPAIAKGIGWGSLQGGGLSALDQYGNEGKIDPMKLAIGVGIGGALGGISRPLEGKAHEYDLYRKEQRLYEEDPSEYIASSPKAEEAIKNDLVSRARRLDIVDPDNLYAEYSFLSNPTPAETKALLRKVKESIAKHSTLPRKMSTITDREAREHLDNIVVKTNAPNPTIFEDVAPVKPKGVFQGLAKGISKDALPMIGGGYIGHYVGGIPGMLAGGLMVSPATREIADRLLENTARTPLVKGLGTYVPAAGIEYIDQQK